LGVAANWRDGDFAANPPNRKWAGDITDVWTPEGWLNLAVILDLHNRVVIGWAVSDRMKKDLRGIWRCAYVNHPRAAFPIPVAAANIAPMTSEEAAGLWPASIDVWQGQLLR